jgi:hypothetical protein
MIITAAAVRVSGGIRTLTTSVEGGCGVYDDVKRWSSSTFWHSQPRKRCKLDIFLPYGACWSIRSSAVPVVSLYGNRQCLAGLALTTLNASSNSISFLAFLHGVSVSRRNDTTHDAHVFSNLLLSKIVPKERGRYVDNRSAHDVDC